MERFSKKGRTQEDLVRVIPEEKVVTDILKIPGIEDLHNKSFEEMAEVLANIIKSRRGMVELKWVIGERIEVKTAI